MALSRAPSSAPGATRSSAAAPAARASSQLPSPSRSPASRSATAASWPLPAARSRRARPLRRNAAAAAAASDPTTPASSSAPRPKVLIAPAFYLDASVFRPLCRDLRARGFDAALAPVRWYMWTPTLGGRSQRPVLDRLDWALEDLCAARDAPAPVDPHTLELPARGAYGPLEFLREMLDPSQGARPPGPVAPPPAPPLPPSAQAAVVASSAGGWIARILLAGDRAPPYGGRAYEGAARRAHTLVTLGTPHYSSEPVTRRNIDWVNDNAPACFRPGVRYVAVGAGGTSGRELIPGTGLGDFAYESYKLCSGDGGDDGDGVTPLRCALALEGAAAVRLDGAAHTPPLFGARKKGDWYGEGAFLEAWVGFLEPPASE